MTAFFREVLNTISCRNGYFDSLQSERLTNTQIANLAVATIWMRFTWRIFQAAAATVFLMIDMCANFRSLASDLQRNPHSLVLITPSCRHTYVQRALL